MAEKFYTLLTEIGKAKIANSAGFGSKINFVKMKVGDGGGSYYNPREDQEDLINTVWEGNITHVAIDEKNPNWINVEMMIPANVGGFMIREYGVFDEDNNMLAIAKCAESYKPLAEDGSTKELIMKMVLTVSNTENITLKIDPTIIFAKKSEIEILENKIKNIKIPVTSVNSKTGAIELKASDIKTEDGKTIESQLDDITTDNKRLTKDKTITGAINELFTSANNGKKLISDVVGNPLLATDTFQQQHDKIQILKNTFVTNLSKKEQGASSTENLQDLINKINNINVGKKWAEGTGKARESSNKEVCMSVTDLDFSPKTVIINTRSDTYREPYIAIDCTLFKYKTQGWYSGGYIILDDGYVHKNNRGFDFYASNGHISKDTTFQWIAFE
ncbi:phage tail protein [Clostridium botulinum]|uniref:Tail fiber protein n=2 Tax=Clostridium botulinum TaxID=1491 RepID=C1FR70_CLOBJ|nr:phage tail protein [Clostridium botulinum]ACO86364.1 tail fiber protein [Clostridium botulinum A2 str. Kyoto]AUN07400.1 phage tail protein [Clostridium botulinum]AUN18196.1 phage tail protein [Clostridium botulinum]MBN3364329.1 phage tail protein [Clostridium botulinum]MBN3373953.1 phage tail protein [Clostridium botulinum]